MVDQSDRSSSSGIFCPSTRGVVGLHSLVEILGVTAVIGVVSTTYEIDEVGHGASLAQICPRLGKN